MCSLCRCRDVIGPKYNWRVLSPFPVFLVACLGTIPRIFPLVRVTRVVVGLGQILASGITLYELKSQLTIQDPSLVHRLSHLVSVSFVLPTFSGYI
jgi:hypothetical protein